MSGKPTRRDFLKTIGAVGVGSILAVTGSASVASSAVKSADTDIKTVPTRPFGKTGVDVSILSLGGVLDISDVLVFKQAFNMGVTYWDTADSYKWGKNEKAIGKYFARFPEDRKKVFLVTKASTSEPQELTEKLNTSLERMNTSYIDMYFIHYVKDAKKELTKEVKAWADKVKAQGKIRFFGFSAHKNMEHNMLVAAELGWVDGIMMSYNYRLMGKDDMKRAVDACVKSGIGLTAMKTQAAFSANFYASIGSEKDTALGMTERFINQGYTAEQAKLMAVWQNPNIASICSAMPNMTILKANVAAAMDRGKLSSRDKRLLDLYAKQTASGYCAGCANVCESAIACDMPISDLLRYSMYYYSYGERDKARLFFKSLPADVKESMLEVDYANAEQCCPQNLPIGKVLKRWYDELA